MTNDTEITYAQQTDHAGRPVGTHVVSEERVVEPRTVEVERPSRVGPFIAGFLSAALAFAIGVGVFLAVSDSDDDGNIDVEVPAVDVNIGE